VLASRNIAIGVLKRRICLMVVPVDCAASIAQTPVPCHEFQTFAVRQNYNGKFTTAVISLFFPGRLAAAKVPFSDRRDWAA
jgi:hypothetical protein